MPCSLRFTPAAAIVRLGGADVNGICVGNSTPGFSHQFANMVVTTTGDSHEQVLCAYDAYVKAEEGRMTESLGLSGTEISDLWIENGDASLGLDATASGGVAGLTVWPCEGV